jgi:hypothetical protein
MSKMALSGMDALALTDRTGWPGATGPQASAIRVRSTRRHFDPVLIDRCKSAFTLPLGQYFRSPSFAAVMEDRLLPGMAARGIVDLSVVRRWWRRALSAPATTEGF